MKRLINKFVFGIVLIPLCFYGCQKEGFLETEVEESSNLKNYGIVDYCGQPVENVLYAGQVLDIGKVIIGNDEDTLFVTIETNKDWLMTNTKVFVGAADDIPVTKKGNPVRGKFTYKTDHAPFIGTFTYKILLADLGKEFVVATHADVVSIEKEKNKIIVTGEETAWGYGDATFDGNAWGWYLNYKVKPCCPDHVIVFRDHLPWNNNSQINVLEAMGFTNGKGTNQYELATSAEIGVLSLDPYHDLVIITNDQRQAFYNTIAGNESYFYDFVKKGGKLLWESADYGWNYGIIQAAGITLPGGIVHGTYFNNWNLVADNTLPLVQGLPSPMYGTFASHTYFSDLPAVTIVYCTDNLAAQNPTLIEFNLGYGTILMTGQPIEYHFYYNADMRDLLPRIYAYLTCKEIPEKVQLETFKVKAVARTSAGE